MKNGKTESLREAIGQWIESPRIQNIIITLIILNAITLGLETSVTVQQYAGESLLLFERMVLTVFVAEILLKLYAFGPRFFRNGWNTFDFIVVSFSLLPDAGPFTVLRALRILRVLRLLAKAERLRHIVESLLKVIPSIGWIASLLVLVFYVFGVMGTKLFADSFPEQFGHLGRTLFSLFQVMTLESWSQEIARPVMAVYPYAWIYFVTFILITAFTVLNLFIGIIVNTMQERHFEEEESRRSESEAQAHAEREEMLRLIRDLNVKVDSLQARLQTR